MTDAVKLFRANNRNVSAKETGSRWCKPYANYRSVFFLTEHNTFKVSVVHISRNYRWLNVLHILWRSICSLKLQCVEL